MVAIERETAAVGAPSSADAIPLTLRRTGGSPRQVLALSLIGTLVLALFASHDLSSWLNRMGDGPLLVPLQHAAAAWDDAVAKSGLDRPAATLRGTIRRLLEAEWPGQN